MPRIPVHSVADTPEQSRDELKALETKFGKVLNIHGEMAHSPVVLQGYVALQRVIGDYGTFDAATREAIALVVCHRSLFSVDAGLWGHGEPRAGAVGVGS